MWEWNGQQSRVRRVAYVLWRCTRKGPSEPPRHGQLGRRAEQEEQERAAGAKQPWLVHLGSSISQAVPRCALEQEKPNLSCPNMRGKSGTGGRDCWMLWPSVDLWAVDWGHSAEDFCCASVCSAVERQ